MILDLGTEPQRVEIVNLEPFEDDESREQDLTSSPTNATTENRCLCVSVGVCVCVCLCLWVSVCVCGCLWVYLSLHWHNSLELHWKHSSLEHQLDSICSLLSLQRKAKQDAVKILSYSLMSIIETNQSLWPVLLLPTVASRLLSLRLQALSPRSKRWHNRRGEIRTSGRAWIHTTSWQQTTKNTTTVFWHVSQKSFKDLFVPKSKAY